MSFVYAVALNAGGEARPPGLQWVLTIAALVVVGTFVAVVRHRFDLLVERPLRLGGDEFAFVLVATDAVVAHHFAERIRLAVRAEFAADPIPVTISVGLASYPRHCPGLADLFRAADDAVYAAKREGRDCTVIGQSQLPEPVVEPGDRS